MIKIVGVDFSGAGSDESLGKTWITEGHLQNDTLMIDDSCSIRSISRAELENLLKGTPDGAVIAMDFPLSVPLAFAEFWCPSANEMPHLWAAAAAIELKEFREQVTRFAEKCNSELLRVGDLYFPNAQPCLHQGRPNMVPMTFRGMQMMHRLWKTSHFCVPPLSGSPKLPVLLEVMPGAALRNFNLPSTRYKDGNRSQQQKRLENRKRILNSLCSGAGGVQLQVSENNVETCIRRRDGDGLDSLVAAIVAARWALCEADFCVPSDEVVTNLKRNQKNKRQASCQAKGLTKLEAARLEGWLYAPKPL